MVVKEWQRLDDGSLSLRLEEAGDRLRAEDLRLYRDRRLPALFEGLAHPFWPQCYGVIRSDLPFEQAVVLENIEGGSLRECALLLLDGSTGMDFSALARSILDALAFAGQSVTRLLREKTDARNTAFSYRILHGNIDEEEIFVTPRGQFFMKSLRHLQLQAVPEAGRSLGSWIAPQDRRAILALEERFRQMDGRNCPRAMARGVPPAQKTGAVRRLQCRSAEVIIESRERPPNSDLQRKDLLMDLARIEAAVREILLAVGEDPDRPGLLETPRRVARMYQEIFAGLERDPSEDVKLFEEYGNDEMVLVANIPFYSVCEHHLLPFIGKAHVVYIPRSGRVLGLSKIARVVDTAARKPQLQERLTSQIADIIHTSARPYGVCVVLEGEHLCMTMRGIKKAGAKTVTSALRGICKSDARSRSEALALIRQSRDE